MSETQLLTDPNPFQSREYFGNQQYDFEPNGNEFYDESFQWQDRYESAVLMLQSFFRHYGANEERLRRLQSNNIEKVGDSSSKRLTIVKRPGNKGRRPPTRGHHQSIAPIDPDSVLKSGLGEDETNGEKIEETTSPSTPSTPSKVRGGVGFGKIDMSGVKLKGSVSKDTPNDEKKQDTVNNDEPKFKLRRTINLSEEKTPPNNNTGSLPFPVKLRKTFSEPNDEFKPLIVEETKKESTPPKKPPPDPNVEVKKEETPRTKTNPRIPKVFPSVDQNTDKIRKKNRRNSNRNHTS